MKCFGKLNSVELVKIPRCLIDPAVKLLEWNIHTFTDASEQAYAAAVCVCHVYDNGEITVRLITWKSRLAPLKAITIPTLELLGALPIGTRQSAQVCAALEISTHTVVYWMISAYVGYWVKGQSREYKPFV